MTELGMQKNYCEWHLDDEDANNWVSACGGSFWFEEGDPKENKMKYCPYCGRHLTQLAPDAEESADLEADSTLEN